MSKSATEALPRILNQSLHHQEDTSLLSLAIGAIAECVWIANMEGEVIFVNESFVRTYGYGREEILGKNLSILQPTGSASGREEGISRVVFQREWRGDVRSHRKDGSEFSIALSTSMVYGDTGAPRAIIFVGADLTAKQGHVAVRESEERYRNTLQSISDAIMIVNEDGVIETVNDAAMSKYLTLAKGLVAGTHVGEIFSPMMAGRWLDAIKNVLRAKSGIQLDETLSIDERTVWLLTKLDPLLDLNGGCRKVVIVSRDFTREREQEEYLRYFSMNILHAQEEERKRIARELHDGLAQALAALKLELVGMCKNLGNAAVDLQSRIQQTIISVTSLLEEARRIAMNLTPEVLEDIGLTSAIRKLTAELSRKQDINTVVELIDIDNHFSPPEEIHIYRILQEVFANISHHADAKNASLTITEVAHSVKFCVSDDGAGFDVQWALSSLAAKGHLGLRGLQERARLLNGRLEIGSGAGRGTTVTLLIPMNAPNKGESR